ncbi:golvesin C-terminal-like domain-containing protein [Paenibacillus sedimenti]|uniref:Right-handed parallel beta-helix repeat-containing protein n=1 Tax=Paenibacillus sedimenti TaxID=2770274 RepID=A0A926KMJ0_9BACL|nr:right-handed parallel beta-helix repeat-containing protein [Paenibacillus sedimenti]MBD0379741.1 right-handed parallel beta-helix repeat-containing protein [Paenibacillus sedimenti]
MKKGFIVFIFFLMLFSSIASIFESNRVYAAVQKEFYVSPTGSDTSGNGTIAAPFASMDKARLAVRSYLASNTLTGDVIVYFSGGTYKQISSVTFSSEDSGKDGFNVIYRNMLNENPVFSGGEVITNWIPENENVFKANVYDSVYNSVYSSVYTQLDFRQIYVNGTRGIRARTPNEGNYYTISDDAYNDFSQTSANKNGLIVPASQLTNVTNLSDNVEMSVLIEWMHKRLRISGIESVTEDAGKKRAVINETEWEDITVEPQGNQNYRLRQYWLENSLNFLDSPGEWYFNKSTGYLYYRPRPGENMNTAEVVIPRVQSLIELKGTFTAPVTNLVFQGLEFQYTNWSRPNDYGFVDVQANSLIPSPPNDMTNNQYRHDQRKDRVPGAIMATTSDNIKIMDNRFKNLGGTGVLFDMGGNDNLIKGNSFMDLSAGAVEIGNDAYRPIDTRMWPRRNTVSNNYMTRIGRDYFGSVGILGYYNDSLLVEHNEIEDIPYTGISVGWGWTTDNCSVEAKNNRIQYNLVSNYVKTVKDGGGIYTACAQTGSTISNNYVRNQLNNVAGIYLDGSTQGYNVTNNVTSSIPKWLFMQIYGNQVSFNNTAEWNYTDNAAQDANLSRNTVANNQVINNGNWPAQAQAIMSNAGLEPAYKHIKGGTVQDSKIVIVDNVDNGFYVVSGTWLSSDGLPNKYGSNYRYAATNVSATAKVRWSPELALPGDYDVYVWYPGHTNRCSDCKYKVIYNGGSQEVPVNETTSGGTWVKLGVFPFLSGSGGSVELTNQANGQYVDADAVKFVKVEVVVDNTDPGFTEASGFWYTAGSLPDKYGSDYRYAVSSTTANAKVRWIPNIQAAGNYNVYIWYPAHSNRCTNCKYTVYYNGGSQVVTINQTTNGGQWISLGTFAFLAGTGGYLELNNQAVGAYVGADAARFEKQ